MTESAVSYEERLDADAGWALSEGSRYFEERGAVQEALRKITRRLDQLGVSYAVVGGMALFRHGYRRFTEDVDILVTEEGLREIHQHLDGLGYLPPFPRSKNLRDTELGVRIEFVVAGRYPGDGKPKPVAFPQPEEACHEQDGIRYLDLDRLVELKLASGTTGPGRMRDLADVIELIRLLGLPEAFAERLNPFVREKYGELWRSARRRYVRRWSERTQARAWDDLLAASPDSRALLEQMRAEGVSLEVTGESDLLLVTTDPEVARKYEMYDETEYWMEEPDR